MTTRRALTTVSALAVLFCAPGGRAQTTLQGLTVIPVTMEMAPGEQAKTLTIENHTDRAATFQVRPYAWSQPELLILPVATLVVVIVPYIFRMMRAAMIEALESDYVEMARLKGVPEWRLVLMHALPNALAPTIQVIGLTFLYLAGGVVVVEFVFNFPGIGQGLVFAVNNRDIPVIQFIVVALAAFYVVMNIVTDVVALLATPRRRIAR